MPNNIDIQEAASIWRDNQVESMSLICDWEVGGSAKKYRTKRYKIYFNLNLHDMDYEKADIKELI